MMEGAVPIVVDGEVVGAIGVSGATGAQDAQVAAWLPGQDVLHDTYGPGWVWGSRRGLVTIRFETLQTGPGPIRTVPADDPRLHHVDRSEDSEG